MKFFLFIVIFTLGTGPVLADIIQPGKPTRDGTDEYTVQYLVMQNGQFMHVTKPVFVPISKDDTPKTKAEAIVRQMFFAGITAMPKDLEGLAPEVNVLGTVLQKRDGSGEEIAITKPSLSAGEIAIAVIDLEGILSGVDSAGNASIFHAILGYDGLVDEANLSSSDPSLSTPADALTKFYDQFLLGLPISQRPLLTLDLTHNEILFNLPPGQTNYFVDIATTDTSATPSGGFIEIPEPPSMTLLSFVVFVIFISWKQRKRTVFGS